MKKLLTILTLILLASCQNTVNQEAVKTGKANSASTRINSSDSNSNSIFKELDE